MGFRLIPLATSCIAAVALTSTLAAAQSSDDEECKYITAKRGEGAVIVPNEEIQVEDLDQFKYFLNKQEGLLEPFTVEEEDEDRCIAAIPVFEQAAAQAAATTAAAAAAPAAVAPAAGVAPTTLAAGSLAGSLGVAGLAGIGLIGVVAGTVAVTNGGGGGTTSTVSTVNIPSVGPE